MGIFQIRGLVFFGLTNREKRYTHRDETVDERADHARRVYQAFDNVETRTNVQACFRAAGFERQNHSGQTILTMNEVKLRDSHGIRELCEIDYFRSPLAGAF
jgi:hypothetical protein